MPVEKSALDSIGLDALHVAAKAAAEDVIRSHGWKGMVEDADLLGTDERYLVLADPAAVAGLITEIKALRRALGGMLFAFDDGVGQDWSKDLLDFARLVTPAVEYKPELLLIQPAPVVRDEYGMFQHPDLPDFDEGDGEKCKAWVAQQGLQLVMFHLETDAPEEIADRYFASDEPHCGYWEPSKPEGDGWFCLAIHDTDDGPVCWWARREVKA